MMFDRRSNRRRKGKRLKFKVRGKIYGAEAQRGRDTDPTLSRLGFICVGLVFNWGVNSRECAEGRGGEELERVQKRCEVVLMREKSWEDRNHAKNGNNGRIEKMEHGVSEHYAAFI